MGGSIIHERKPAKWLTFILAFTTKYAVELDNALKEYAELQEQASDFDPVELHKVRQAIRTEHERDAAKRLQDAYGTKYDRARMYDSKRSVANLLGEEAEERSVTEKLRTRQQNRMCPKFCVNFI